MGCFAQLRKTLELQPAHPEAWAQMQLLDPAALDLEFLEKATIALVNTKIQQLNTLTAAVSLCRKNLVWPALDDLERLLAKAFCGQLDKVSSSSACFTLLGAKVPQQAHLKAASSVWQYLTANSIPLPPRPLPARGDRAIRVGFLSSDLRGHAIGFLIVGLLESLPRERIEWYAYNNSFSDSSDSRSRMRIGLDRFINIAPLTDRELATRIREDAIDILIDLNGMTQETRALVLSLRPAPIQITWLGMSTNRTRA